MQKNGYRKARRNEIKMSSDKEALIKKHKVAVNRRIINAFTMLGISEKDGRKIIRAIVREELPNIFIKY